MSFEFFFNLAALAAVFITTCILTVASLTFISGLLSTMCEFEDKKTKEFVFKGGDADKLREELVNFKAIVIKGLFAVTFVFMFLCIVMGAFAKDVNGNIIITKLFSAKGSERLYELLSNRLPIEITYIILIGYAGYIVWNVAILYLRSVEIRHPANGIRVLS